MAKVAAMLLLAMTAGCVQHRAVVSVPQPPANDFQAYARVVETRIEKDGFASNFLRLARDEQTRARLRDGEILTSPAGALGVAPSSVALNGVQVQHWIGAMFLPRATLARALPRLQDYDNRKLYMRPEVIESHQLGRQGSTFQVYLRLSEKSIVSGVFDVVLKINYRRLDDAHLIIESRSEKITEVTSPNAPDRGLLQGLNHYWRIAASDGGLYMECEALVLSRRPPGFVQWIADPLIAQAARRTLVGTLEATRRIVESGEVSPPNPGLAGQ